MEFFSDASARIHVASSRPGASRCQLRIPRELRRRRCPRGFLGALVMGVDPRLAGAGPKQPELPGNSSGKQPRIPLENGPATFHFPDFPAFPAFPAAWRRPGELGVGRVIPGLDIGSDSLPGTNPPCPWDWIPCGCGARECGRSSGSGGSGGFSSLRDSGIPSVELGSRKVFLGETEGALELPNRSRTSAKWDEIHSQKNPPSNPKSESWPIPFPWDGFIRENWDWERGLVGFGGGKELRDSSHSRWGSSHSRWDNSGIPAPAGNSGGSDPAWKVWEFLGKGRSRARLIPGSSRSRSRGFALGKGLPCGNSARPSRFPVLCLFPGNLWERPSPIPAPRPSQASRILGRFGFLSPHPGAQRVPKKQLRPELGFLEKPWNKTILGKGREIARARSCRRDTAIPKPFPAFPSPGSIPGSARGAAWGSPG